MTNVTKNFEKLLQNRATNTYKAHEFIKEYGFFISIVLIVKIATSVFSAYAGYFYLKFSFVEILNSELLAIIFTIISLVLIEFLTNISLSKFYKTSLRGDLKAAVGFIILSFVFFGLSFFISAHGLSQRQGQKTDNTAVILSKYALLTDELKKQAENERNDNKTAIETIKSNPSGWRNSKRDVLQPDQLKEINYYYNQLSKVNINLSQDIATLEEKQAQEMKINSGNILLIENKYFMTVSIILLIQFFVNGLLMFFYSKIYADKQKEQLAKEIVQTFANDIQGSTDSMIISQISNSYHTYLNALQFTLNSQAQPVKAITPEKTIGFKKDVSNNSNYDIVIPEDKNIQHSIKNISQLKNETTCKHCNKPFNPYSKINIFCSTECRLGWHKNNSGFELQKYMKRKH